MNINRVLLTGNLTKDPELRDVGSTKVCELRLAVNDRKKQGDEWVEKPMFFTVTCWGKQAENVAKYMEKGRAIAVDGKLQWREWDHDGRHYEAVSVTALSVQFLPDGSGGGSKPDTAAPVGATPGPTAADDPYA